MSSSQASLRPRAWIDWIVAGALLLLTLFVYLRTLAPTVAYLFDDSLEFQLLAVRMAIAHPTGYPLYSILIKLATVLPFGDVAYRVNLVSAVSGALAVAFLYLAARSLTDRFLRANTRTGEILARVPALTAALVFAFGETFWSQAVLAEVYTFQAFLTAVMLWLALGWGERFQEDHAGDAGQLAPPLIPLAFLAGLMLTHHRMSVLIFPALAVYVLSYDRSWLRRPLTLLQLALAFALPLLFYLYLPLRGTVTSSLDGAYQNTPAGFLNWVLGTAYTVFLTQNPLNQDRTTGYYFALFFKEFTVFGWLTALGGFVALFMRAWREWLLLGLGLVANLVFALTYRVADINVFFIPAFLFTALLLAAGLAGLLWLIYYVWPNRAATAVGAAGAVLCLLAPVVLYRENYARVDLSSKTDAAAYGRDLLAQPLPANATIIGILGEMSLVRYFQESQGLRPDIETVAADKEADRLQAIADALKRGRAVYLTRPLTGIEKQDSLSAVGPLIQVLPQANKKDAPAPATVVNEDFGDVKLLGYSRENAGDGAADTTAQRTLPITLYWQVRKRPGLNLLVSLKLLDAKARAAGQIDRQPVLDAYPTSTWRSGEYIADYYAVPIFTGAAPGDYALQLTLYDPSSGKVYGQRELEHVTITPQTQNVPMELLDVNETVLDELGGMQLAGYTFDTTDPIAPGAGEPLTLLWRAPQAGSMREIEIMVTDALGKVVQTQTLTVGGPEVQAGQYLRQDLNVSLPSPLTNGKYPVRLTVQGGSTLPLETNSRLLGTVEVKGQ